MATYLPIAVARGSGRGDFCLSLGVRQGYKVRREPRMAAIEASDEELAARARSGSSKAFQLLLERHQERLEAAASRRLPKAIQGRVSASDVVQECFLVAHLRIADFEDRGSGSFKRWLARILRNKVHDEVRDHLGRARRTVGREVARRGSRSDVMPVADRAPSPGSRAQGTEERALFKKALLSLTDDQQAVIRLVHEGGLTTVEAAEHLHRTGEAVRKLYARAVANLAHALEEHRRSPS